MDEAKARAGLARFDRRFFEGRETFTALGAGPIGGKASGLRAAREALDGRPASLRFPHLEISVPTLTVIGTDAFDLFLERNRLHELVHSGADDRRIAAALQAATMPTELVGDLWALARQMHVPLAVRSSSLLEDALEHPFAGVYATKMIPNDAPDPERRFHRLVEAVKFVWASAFFRDARAYIRAAGRPPEDEKMAVIVQEVVGRRHGPRFYPEVSGVARSWNFYPTGRARPAEGVVDLAFGLGKTIVDGGLAWTYSPAHPRAVPPFNSIEDRLERAQSDFWAVRMGVPAVYDPTAETEYLERSPLGRAEEDGTLPWTCSTYDPESDRVVPGTARRGPRIPDFAPLLGAASWPVNDAIRGLLELFSERLGTAVEIEFALTLPEGEAPARLGFLQVRPMMVRADEVAIAEADWADPRALVRSARAMGNGAFEGIRDVVYVKPGPFEARHTPAIAAEVDCLNQALAGEGRPYLLVGFGRWGSADPWLGIPVAWSQISGARVIVEASLPAMNVEMSQGAHFFHNLLGFRVAYLSAIDEGGGPAVDWAWLDAQPAAGETAFVRHVRLAAPLDVRVDGRTGRGLVRRTPGEDR